ncbi:sugar ABC transporter permease [Amycolatopsis endophytica]|uniref:ABC-type sugar transport system permease subunit n=1 Tax=Amycolatopsis endophytica TaxID=860233 RepID=A0A853BD02_9PSEU|nr:sugar ABC transporter permease [Amycolatopsis endophytica]NYI92296.1 ABC-type sugar transport system permease subunit [Amycolatopsis endophytica]
MAVLTAPAQREQAPPARRGPAARRRTAGYLFILPIVVFFAFFVGYPLVRSLYLSLTQWSGYGRPKFVGLLNFSQLLGDPVFWQALRTTLIFTASTMILQTALPMLLAVFLHRGWKGSVVFRTLLFVPAVISLVVTGVLWQLMYDSKFGALNGVLRAFGLGGLAHDWLADPVTVIPALILVSVWQTLGLYLVIFLAGLQGIDPTLYEAARIDGAGGRQQFFHITVPMLRRVTSVVLVLNMMNGLKTFDLIFVMTGGGPNHGSEVLGTYLYGLAFGSGAGATPALGYATAISMVVLVLCMVGTVVQLRLSKRG